MPLYNVLCDVLGINGKTASQAYTAVTAAVDEGREITVQFVAINNDGMPWSFTPDTRMMRVIIWKAEFGSIWTSPILTWFHVRCADRRSHETGSLNAAQEQGAAFHVCHVRHVF